MSEIVKMVPGRTDHEAANAIKMGVMGALEPVLKIIKEAKQEGFEVQFAIGSGPLGTPALTQLRVIKEF